MREIYNDPFWRELQRVAIESKPRGILEVGGGTGEGSTTALIGHGIPVVSIEPDQDRHAQLSRRLNDHGVAIWDCATAAILKPSAVERFYHETTTNLNRYSLETVLGWLVESVKQLDDHVGRGIEKAREHCRLEMVLLDGSPFSGLADLGAVIGEARVIALDDINDIKNWHAYHCLRSDPEWSLCWEDWSLRNGAAIFARRNGKQ